MSEAHSKGFRVGGFHSFEHRCIVSRKPGNVLYVQKVSPPESKKHGSLIELRRDRQKDRK